MALNVEQLQALQNKIGSKPVMPDSLSRLSALEDLENIATNKLAKATDPRYSRRFRNTPLEGGGQPNLSSQAQNVAKAGRMGDSMLMHVSPSEVRGLSSLRPVTKNPETGLPEAVVPLVAAAVPAAWGALAGVGAASAAGAGIATATAGAGIMAGLSGMWGALGPIGQGMLIGGGMGGLKSLFMGGQNPLRDILMGAAMGGISGGLFGGAGTGADIVASDAFTAGAGPSIGATVPEVVSGTATVPLVTPGGGAFAQGAAGLNPQAIPYGQAVSKTLTPDVTNIFAGSRMPPLTRQPTPFMPSGGPGSHGATPTGEVYVRPPIAPPTKQIAYPVKQGYTSDAARQAAIETAKTTTPATDKTFFGGLKDWWKDREWYEKAGITGLGALAASEFLSRPGEQQELEGLKPIQPFAEGDPKIPLKPISPLTEQQIAAAYTGPSGTGIDTYFQQAKKGGIVALQMGGSIPMPGTHSHNQKYGTFGGPAPGSPGYYARYGTFGIQDPYNINPLAYDPKRNPHLQDPIYGLVGGGDGGTAPAPFEFPDVDPFQSNLSSFNVEDALSRIGGQAQLPAALPEQVASIPSSVPTDTSALGDLLSRFKQTAQVDPIAGLVESEVGVNQGGTVGLARGGVFEGRVQGEGDGMADKVAFGVRPQTPKDIPNTPDVALLSSDEYVVPADVVSMLGNGSSTAGAKSLDKFNQLMRKKAHGTNKQQRQLNAGRELSSLG